jgi:hypothetical protein
MIYIYIYIYIHIYITVIGLTPGSSSTSHIRLTPGSSSTSYIRLTPGSSSTSHIYTQYTEYRICEVQAVPRFCELYPGICLTTEEKARKNLSYGSTIQEQWTYSTQNKTVTQQRTQNTLTDLAASFFPVLTEWWQHVATSEFEIR